MQYAVYLLEPKNKINTLEIRRLLPNTDFEKIISKWLYYGTIQRVYNEQDPQHILGVYRGIIWPQIPFCDNYQIITSKFRVYNWNK